jgi:uncharacterized small protein (DUF1192 family)
VSYSTSSDYRLKTQVAKMTGALARLMRLKPSTYLFKHDVESGEHEGFLAHELQEEVPLAVTGKKDAVRFDPVFNPDYDPQDVKKEDVVGVEESPVIQTVDYSKLVPLLVASVQELTQEVALLRAEIKHLKKGK